MNIFFEALAVVGAVVVGIMVLTIFFKLLGMFADRPGRGIPDGIPATVHLTCGKSIENVKFAGYTGKNYDKLRFHHADGRLVIIPEQKVSMIEFAPRSA